MGIDTRWLHQQVLMSVVDINFKKIVEILDMLRKARCDLLFFFAIHVYLPIKLKNGDMQLWRNQLEIRLQTDVNVFYILLYI